MRTGDPTPNSPENPEFKFATEVEMQQEAGKIATALTPFLGSNIAREVGNYFLGAAQRMDGTLKMLLAEKNIQEEWSYNGATFVNKTPTIRHSITTRAVCGFLMLRGIINYQIEASFRNVDSKNPAQLGKALGIMLDEVEESSVMSTINLLEKFRTHGTLAPLSNFRIIDVLGKESPAQKGKKLNLMRDLIEYEKIKEAQDRERRKIDEFIKKSEEQFSNDPK